MIIDLEANNRTPEELAIIQQIEGIKREYQKQIEPLVKRLVAINNIKIPRYVFVVDESSETLRDTRNGVYNLRTDKDVD